MSLEQYERIERETAKAAHYLHRKCLRGELLYHGIAVDSDCGCLRHVRLIVYGATDMIMRHVRKAYPLAQVVFAD